MTRSLRLRFAVSLTICALVGLALAALAGDGGPGTRRASVVTTSSQTLEGVFRGSSADGIVLGREGRLEVVPWEAVARLSVEDGGTPVNPRDHGQSSPGRPPTSPPPPAADRSWSRLSPAGPSGAADPSL